MFAAERISYSQTKAFSSIVLDYIQGHPSLQPFYTALPTLNNIKEAIRVKEQQPVDRLLVTRLSKAVCKNQSESGSKIFHRKTLSRVALLQFVRHINPTYLRAPVFCL
jgi:hypothetical protein